MYLSQAQMAEAVRLTREGRLAEATAAIQRALQGAPPTDGQPEDPYAESASAGPWQGAPGPGTSSADAARGGRPSPRAAEAEVEDVSFRELPARPAGSPGLTDRAAAGLNEASSPTGRPPEAMAHGSATQESTAARAAPGAGNGAGHGPETGRGGRADTGTAEGAAGFGTGAAAGVRHEGSFEAHRIQSGGQSYLYRLYTPAGEADAPRPVLVLLHGCKQDAADFAAGTAMNALAERHGCIVVYPEQNRSANSMGCWNWFEPAHQRRGAGEPAMIAALAAQVVAQCGGDPARVYIAGLSAGGAMAALTAHLYPEVFAAVGIHSGLGPGAAHDVVSAFAAMRKAQRKGPAGPAGAALPAIVFHGSADKTVHPSNAAQIVQDALAAWQAGGQPLQRERQRQGEAGRAAMRTTWRRADGSVVLEQWDVAAGPHAWSGGDAAGSFTDPQGPSASEAMLRFFLAQRRGPAAGV